MHLSNFIEAFDHRITGGSEYYWESFGNSARWLDFESDYAHGSLVFDSVTQIVYMAQVDPKEESSDYAEKPYIWLNPTYKDSYINECVSKGLKYDNAYDDTNYVVLEVDEDFCEKANAIFNNQPFDSRVEVPLDLDDDVIFNLALEAHKRDITLNKMVEILLQNAIDNRIVNESHTKSV